MKYKAYYKQAKKDFKNLKKVTAPEVKGMISRKLETKYVDLVTGGILNPLSTGIINDCFPIVQGVQQFERTGAIVRPMDLEVRGHIAGLAANTRYRKIIFHWKPDNAVLPTLGNILSNGPSGAPDVNSNYNFNNKKLYKILSDKQYYVTTQTAGSQTEKSFVSYHYKISGKKLLSEMAFTLGLVTGENHIHIMLLSDAALAANAVATVFTIRLRYKDA